MSSLIGIAAIALSFIPVLTPIMAPIAAVSGLISLGSGLPVSLKTLGTLIHNYFKYGVAPSKSEVIESAFLGCSVLLTGVGRIAAKSAEFFLEAAGKLGRSANNLAWVAVDAADFISGDQAENNKQFITDYRKQLNEIKKEANVEVDEKEQNDEFQP